MALSEQSPRGSRQHLELMPSTQGSAHGNCYFPTVCVDTMEKTSIKHKAPERSDSVVQGHVNHTAQQGFSNAGRPPHVAGISSKPMEKAQK